MCVVALGLRVATANSNLFCISIDDLSIDPIELMPVLCLVNRAVVTIDEAENRHVQSD